MLDLTLEEAQLMRLLSSFFGRERVIPRISVWTIVGGRVSEQRLYADLGVNPVDLEGWARRTTCLFTIVDDDSQPRLVMEFGEEVEEGVIDLKELDHRRYLAPMLASERIHYVTISKDEFLEIMDPRASLDMFSFLRDKIGDCAA